MCKTRRTTARLTCYNRAELVHYLTVCRPPVFWEINILMRRIAGFLLPILLAATAPLYAHAAPRADADSVFTFAVADQPEIAAPDGTTATLAARISGLPGKPQFVVVPGGITAHGLATEYQGAADLQKQLSTSGVALYAVPGPSDVSPFALGKEAFTRQFSKRYQSFDVQQSHFVLLDSSVALRPEGHLDKAQLDWLDKDLKKVKPEAPILIFLFHSVTKDTPTTRPLDNDYDLMVRLKSRNVCAIFAGDTGKDMLWYSNGIPTIGGASARAGSLLQVTVTPLLITVERVTPASPKPVKVVSIPASLRVKGSVMRVIWDDPDNPFLERRRPAATLSPRAVADNPDHEVGEYRVDSGDWKPMVKDRRDIWTDAFNTRPLSIGVHSADVRLTTSAGVASQEELIFEVERDGKEETRRWAIDLPDAVYASPVRDAESVYVPCTDGKLYALNIATGKKRWVFPGKSPFHASAAVADNLVYAASIDGTLYAVEAASGHVKWHYDSEAPAYSAPIVSKGTVIYASGRQLIAVEPETGNRRWAVALPGGTATDIVVADGRVLAVTTTGLLIASDAASGAERWRYPISATPAISALSTPAVSGSRVYISGADGSLHCVDLVNGLSKWMRAAQNAGDRATGSPAIGAGLVLTAGRTQGNLYAFDALTGEPRWQKATGQPIAGGIKVLENGRSAAVMGLRGHCLVFSTISGERQWGYELGPGNIYSTPDFDGNVLYTATVAGDIQAINGPGVQKP